MAWRVVVHRHYVDMLHKFLVYFPMISLRCFAQDLTVVMLKICTITGLAFPDTLILAQSDDALERFLFGIGLQLCLYGMLPAHHVLWAGEGFIERLQSLVDTWDTQLQDIVERGVNNLLFPRFGYFPGAVEALTHLERLMLLPERYPYGVTRSMSHVHRQLKACLRRWRHELGDFLATESVVIPLMVLKEAYSLSLEIDRSNVG